MDWEHHAQVTRTMTPQLAELIGYFMGDGSLHSRGLRFCVTAGDHDVIRRLCDLGKEAFGLEGHVTPKAWLRRGALRLSPPGTVVGGVWAT